MSYHVGLNKNDFVKEAEAKLNSSLDVTLILHLLRKFRFVFLILFMISGFIAFLYLRYSQPIYESKTVLQINDNKADEVLRLEGIGQNENIIAEEIEQIHSKVFLKRIVEKLDLEVSYYSEGTFKNNELYLSSPFLLKINLKNKSLEGQQIYVKLNDALDGGTIKYGNTIRNFRLNTWFNNSDFDINIYLNPKMDANQVRNNIATNKAFFFQDKKLISLKKELL